MANQNPTGSGGAVALNLPADHVAFLRCAFVACRDGLRDDLAEFPDRLREPKRQRREEAAFGRLLEGLDTGSIVPGRDVRDTLGDLAKVVDLGNEYKRVVDEHEALHGLLGQIDGGRVRRVVGR